MAENKFKVGDIVRITSRRKIPGCERYPVNTITKINEIFTMDYRLMTSYLAGNYWYLEDELELVTSEENSKTYEQGLEEGWKLAGIVGDMEFYKRNDIFGLHYGNNGMNSILKDFTAAEILKKLKEYENNYIRPGDIVKVRSIAGSEYLGVVTQITDDQNSMCILYNDGSVEMTTKNNMIEKTGRSIDISKTLAEVKLNDKRKKNL